MFMRAVAITLTALFVASWLHSTDATCKHPKETKNWKRKRLVDRAVESDIIIYGEVINSPCWKPGFVKPTTPALLTTQAPSGVNSTNATSNATTFNATASTPLTDNTVNLTTVPPTVPYNCSTEFYDAIIKVICVMKGGSVPSRVYLQGFGHGEGTCLDDSYHDLHAYNMLKYLIFIERKKTPTNNIPFRTKAVNHQPAITEIDDESTLEPIFEAIGRNAHLPLGVRNATAYAVCKPYVSSAHACCSTYASVIFILLVSSPFLIY